MAREGLLLSVRACAVLGVTLSAFCSCFLSADPGGDRERSVATLLAVQSAMHEGREHLLRNDPASAVKVLEEQLAYVDGNRSYLTLLRDAYRAHIRDLKLSNQETKVQEYVQRLRILDPDPGAEAQAKAASPSAPTREEPALTASSITPTSDPTRPRTNNISTSPASNSKSIENKDAVTAPASVSTPPSSPAKQPDAKGALVAAPTTSGTPKPTFRGNIDEEKATDKARQLLGHAEQEFARRKYHDALMLYEKANQADRRVTDASQERWAYCKLYHVVEQLNDTTGKKPVLSELESEVRRAMELAPRLEYSNQLLAEIEKRKKGTPLADDGKKEQAEPEVVVKHVDPSADGWSVAETTNFRIYHNRNKETAEQVARIAERTRFDMNRKWFGTAGEIWNPRCEIYLHATGQDYSKATTAPATNPGHSSFKIESGRVISRRIDLRCDYETMLIATLPHETTHTVLAGRFGEQALPRWADEGMAVLSEPRNIVERHFLNLPRHRHEKELFGLQQLMQLNEYPDPRYWGSFYAQSVSLVDFLVKEKGAQVFSRFVRDGMKSGWEASLRQHYGYNGFEELENRWYAHAFDQSKLRSMAQSKTP